MTPTPQKRKGKVAKSPRIFFRKAREGERPTQPQARAYPAQSCLSLLIRLAEYIAKIEIPNIESNTIDICPLIHFVSCV